MEMCYDDDNDSVLGLAAINKSPDVSGAEMSGIGIDVTPQEHVSKTSVTWYLDVLDVVRTRLTPNQMSYDDDNDYALPHAATNKSSDVF
ncbi:unnamed protein product, partial [Ascophyllum nodosum]